MCGESEFGIDKIPRIQDKLYIDAKIRENNIFWSKNKSSNGLGFRIGLRLRLRLRLRLGLGLRLRLKYWA